jgi:sporulation protein YlmC with PRC-barrel domain
MKKTSIGLFLLFIVAIMVTTCSQNAGSGETSQARGTASSITPGSKDRGTPTPRITATIFALLATTTPTEPSASSTPTEVGGIPDSGRSNPLRLSKILDFEVENRDGDALGSVQDAIVELDSVRIRYLLVSGGGLLGMGDRTILVPWRVLNIQESAGLGSQDAFVSKVDQQTFENAPSFDPDPRSLQTSGWDQTYNSYWDELVDSVSVEGITATITPEPAEASQTPGMQRVLFSTDLLDYSVLDGKNEQVGTVTDVILDRKNGSLYYPVVAAGGVLGVGEKWIPVPLRIFALGSQEKSFQLRIGSQKLVEAPNYDLGNLPDFTDPGWDTDIEQYWENIE